MIAHFYVTLIVGLGVVGQQPDAGIPVVEPSSLTRDPNLIGREVVVDDRVRFFQAHRSPRGQVFDELLLKRTDVSFRLPPTLRPERPPKQPVARVTGILQSDGRQIYCEVTALEMLPADLERLDREVKRLAPGDSVGRTTWATWAERRGRDFKDADLIARARTLETEAFLIDADRPNADDLALARRAKGRDLGDDLANALAHRGLRARLELVKTAGEFARLTAEVESLLPRSTEPRLVAGIEDWKARIKANPLVVYRQAPPNIQAALDRSLLADVLQRDLERRVADAPGDAMTLADEARTKLPDRPELAQRLRDRGLSSTEGNVTTMRLSEVETLAKTFRDDGQTDRARALLKNWLEDQRKRLNANDSDGHVILAGQYDRLLDDRNTAASLLADALKADPDSKTAVDAFRRMGYRKSDKGQWFDPKLATADLPGQGTEPRPAPAGRSSDESFRGMSPEQVKFQLGKPSRIVRAATQDATLEQWIYQGSGKTTVVNFRRPRGRAQPEVVAKYSLP